MKAKDGKTWVVRRLILPAPVSAANLMGAAAKSSSGTTSSSPLVALLVRVILLLVIGIVILPFALLTRIIFRRWTVEAEEGDTTRRWKAKSWAAAGAGVKAVSGAIERGDSLETPFDGLKPV